MLTKPVTVSNDDFYFSCENSQDCYPYTATFYYDVSGIRDSVFTDFGLPMEAYLPPERNMINFLFSNAGVYNVHFYTRSGMLYTLNIIAYLKDWQGGISPIQSLKILSHLSTSVFSGRAMFCIPRPKNLKMKGLI